MTSFQLLLRSATVGLLVAVSGAGLASAALAQTPFATVDRTAAGKVSFAAAERGKPILAGGAVNVSGEGFKPGQAVSLYYGGTAIEGAAFTAGADGKFTGSLTVPASAVPGIHPLLVVAGNPYAASVAELKVSPNIPLSGEKAYALTEVEAARGLYQSAYSPKRNSLYVTSAVGRPPVRQSELVKLDADSLKVVARVTPAPAPVPANARQAPVPAGAGPTPAPAEGAPSGPALYAVYGVGVDDRNDTVWVTNTRQNTVSVYKQSDLSLVKQFEPGAVTHARDVAVDTGVNKAYATATGTPTVKVFDAGSLEPVKTIEIRALGRGQEFSAASLSLDPKANRLYVVSLSTGEVAVINTKTDEVEKVIPVPGVRGAIGVSHDPQTGRIYVAAQGSDNLVVLDGATGALIADTPIGAGALNVVFDPVKRRAYVANRGAGTIAVTDPDGKIVANLGPAPLANHVSLGRNGTVYAVDKSAGARNAENDTILKIRPR